VSGICVMCCARTSNTTTAPEHTRPGGNLTGITLDAGIEIWGKRLELLKQAIPSTANAAFLGMRDGWEGSFGQTLRPPSLDDLAGGVQAAERVLVEVLSGTYRPKV
jgi:hypothetical protein